MVEQSNTVKIDKKLLENVKLLIKKESKRIRYASSKQFINVAVQRLLEEEGKTGEQNE